MHILTFNQVLKKQKDVKEPELLDLILNDEPKIYSNSHLDDRTTTTIITTSTNPDKPSQASIDAIETINFLISKLLIKVQNIKTPIESRWEQFKIPKASGGFRTITAPCEELKELQSELVYILKKSAKPHHTAHAYIEKRSIVTNARSHIENNNFVKVDLKDFFNSITIDLIKETLSVQNLIFYNMYDKEELFEIIEEIALYNGMAPQGAVSSPIISNLVRLHLDYCLEKGLHEKYNRSVYTAYADDLTFSSYYKLGDTKKEAIENIIKLINLSMGMMYSKDYFKINSNKVTCSTKYGKNRITGVKVNKDNKLSIGYKEKLNLKKELAILIIQRKTGEELDEDQVKEVMGYWNFLHSVEPDYAKYLLRTLQRKFKLSAPVDRYLGYKRKR